MTKKTINLTSGSIYKSIISFVLPLAAGMLFQQLYSTTDSVVLGRFVGEDALASIGASNQVTNLLIGFFLGIAVGMSVIVAQSYGASNFTYLKRAINCCFFACIAGGIIITVIGLIASKPLLILMKTPENVLNEANVYLRIYFMGSVFNIVYNMGANVLRAVGDTRSPLIILIISSITNIVLDLVFVIVFGMGIAGVGIATLIAQAVSAVLVCYMLNKREEYCRLDVKLMRYDKELFGRIMSLGLPSGLQHAIITVSNIVIQTQVNGFEEAAMAGWTVYWRIDNMLYIPINCLISTAVTFSGQNYGARQYERIKKGMRAILVMANAYGALTCTILLLFIGTLYKAFTSDSEIINYGILQSRMVAPGVFVFVSSQVVLGTIRGTGRSIAPMMISIITMCVIRIIYLLTVPPYFNTLTAVYFAYPATWTLGLICAVVYYIKVKKALTSSCQKEQAVTEAQVKP